MRNPFGALFSHEPVEIAPGLIAHVAKGASIARARLVERTRTHLPEAAPLTLWGAVMVEGWSGPFAPAPEDWPPITDEESIARRVETLEHVPLDVLELLDREIGNRVRWSPEDAKKPGKPSRSPATGSPEDGGATTVETARTDKNSSGDVTAH